MNDVAEADPKSTDIVALVEATPIIVLTDKEKFSDFYKAMKRETDALDADVTTKKGREQIASMAYKVARTKTAIDEAGKKLNEEARLRINAIDEARREIRGQLDALKEEVRRPLTAWEEAEAQREEQSTAEIAKLREMGRVDFMDTAEDVKERLDALNAMTLDGALHGGSFDVADAARDDAITSLTAAHERLVREEGERAELERLRREAEERQREEAERHAREEEERLKAEAEKAEAERIAKVQREAEERAKAEAERKAQEEREAAERAHQEELAAERRRAEDAERAAQAERDRIAREEAERRAAAEREAEEQRKREADRAHRGKVMGEAKAAIMEAGPADEGTAKAIVLAIAAGNVPSVSIRF